MLHRFINLLLGLCLGLGLFSPAFSQSQIDRFSITSTHLTPNLISVDPERRVQVYLPDGYDQSEKRYPVIYVLNTFYERETAVFDNHDMDARLDAAIADGRMRSAIVVTADFSTSVAHSLYTDSPVTGNWRQFFVQELVPEIDRRYRTFAKREARALFGYHLGGYGAIRIASRHPDQFGTVYAMHPVATGMGYGVQVDRPDWNTLFTLTSLDDFNGNWMAEIFTSIYQAHSPDPDNPPLFIDPTVKRTGDGFDIQPDKVERFASRFFLNREVPRYADALNSLNGFKMDWGRHDPNQDHVISNENYTRTLRLYGVAHEAEEYHGGWGERHFVAGGRVDTDLFPFLMQTLAFE